MFLWVCLTLIVAAAFFLQPRFRDLWWPSLFWQLYALLVVLVLCLAWRTIALRLVLAAFLAGAGPVMLVTLGIQKLFAGGWGPLPWATWGPRD